MRDGEQIIVVTDRGQMIRTFVNQVRLAGRNTQGVRIIDTREGEKVVAVERVDAVAGEDPPAEADATPVDGGSEGAAGRDAEGTTPAAEPGEPPQGDSA